MATICGDCGGEMREGLPHCWCGTNPSSGVIMGVVVPAPGVGPEPFDTGTMHRAPLQEQIARLRAELSRARAMRASTGCACAALVSDLPPSHVAGCPAMEGSRLRSERNFWRDRAHAMLAAARTMEARCEQQQALDVLGAVERAYEATKETP